MIYLGWINGEAQSGMQGADSHKQAAEGFLDQPNAAAVRQAHTVEVAVLGPFDEAEMETNIASTRELQDLLQEALSGTSIQTFQLTRRLERVSMDTEGH